MKISKGVCVCVCKNSKWLEATSSNHVDALKWLILSKLERESVHVWLNVVTFM